MFVNLYVVNFAFDSNNSIVSRPSFQFFVWQDYDDTVVIHTGVCSDYSFVPISYCLDEYIIEWKWIRGKLVSMS